MLGQSTPLLCSQSSLPKLRRVTVEPHVLFCAALVCPSFSYRWLQSSRVVRILKDGLKGRNLHIRGCRATLRLIVADDVK